MLEVQQENSKLKEERELLFKRLDHFEKTNLEMQQQLRELQSSLQRLNSLHFDRENTLADADIWTEKGLLGEARLGNEPLPLERCTSLGKPNVLVKNISTLHGNSPLGLFPTLLVPCRGKFGVFSQQSRLVHSGRRLKVHCLVYKASSRQSHRSFLTLRLFLLSFDGV